MFVLIQRISHVLNIRQRGEGFAAGPIVDEHLLSRLARDQDIAARGESHLRAGEVIQPGVTWIAAGRSR